MKLTTKIWLDKLAREIARDYRRTDDKYVLCLDALGFTLTDDGESRCDYWVGKLEHRIDLLARRN